MALVASRWGLPYSLPSFLFLSEVISAGPERGVSVLTSRAGH